MTGHLIAEPVPVHEIVFDCPEDVWPVVAKCLAINPADRYQTFEEVSDALSALIRQSVPAAHPLARRVVQEKARVARQASFASLPPEPDEPAAPQPAPAQDVDHDFSERVTLPHTPQRGQEAPSIHVETVRDEAEQRMTAPLVNFIPQSSVLPFSQKTRPAEHAARGRGFTEPIPALLSGRLAQVSSTSPAVVAPQASATTSAPLRAPTPHSSSYLARRAQPLDRMFLIAPLVGLALTVSGSVFVSIVRARPIAADQAPVSAPSAAPSAAELPSAVATGTAAPEVTAAPAAPEPEPTVAPTTSAPSAVPSSSAKIPAPKPAKPKAAPRASAPAPAANPPNVVLFDLPKAPQKKGSN
jgi:serine/threonine-protein kinase